MVFYDAGVFFDVVGLGWCLRVWGGGRSWGGRRRWREGGEEREMGGREGIEGIEDRGCGLLGT